MGKLKTCLYCEEKEPQKREGREKGKAGGENEHVGGQEMGQ